MRYDAIRRGLSGFTNRVLALAFLFILLSGTFSAKAQSTPDCLTDLCELFGKPQQLTLVLTGGTEIVSAQDPSKVSVTGDAISQNTVFIRATDKDDPTDTGGKIFFEGTVNLGDAFTISSILAGDDELRSETHIHIFDGEGGQVLQSIEFHTSCSQQLRLGDQYGAVTLIGFLDEDGQGGVNDQCVGFEPPPPSSDCVECGFGEDDADKVSELTLTYSGAAGVVQIYNDDKQEADELLFEGFLSPGEEVTIQASTVGRNEFSSKVGFYTDGVKVAEIHTSCSSPVGAGTTEANQSKGENPNGVVDYTVLSGKDKDGRPLCDIPPPPTPTTPDCLTDLCELFGKPQQLTLVLTGGTEILTAQDPSKVSVTGGAVSGTVYVRATDKDDPNDLGGKTFFEGPVTVDDAFTISSILAGDDELRSETHIHIFDGEGGQVLQSIEFHTSCSQQLRLGDQYGAVTLIGFLDKDGLGGTNDQCVGFEPPPPPTADCLTDLCELFGKPARLTMRLTGGTGVLTAQDADKVSVASFGEVTGTVFVRATDKSDPDDTSGKIFFEGSVGVDTDFVIDAANAGEDDLKSETHVHIFDGSGNLLQSIEFHTSCSQQLRLGDQYGAVTLIGFLDKDGQGGLNDQCVGFEPPPPPTADCLTDLCELFGKPQQLTLVYTGGTEIVSAQDPSKVSVTGDPNDAPTVFIRATDKDDPNDTGGKIFFEGTVNLGDAFTISSILAGDDELRSETHIHIFDGEGGQVLQSIEFHTSCSQQLRLGDQYGAVTLIGFLDKDGLGGTNDQCVGFEPPPPDCLTDLCELFDKPQKLTFVYTGGTEIVSAQDPNKVSVTGDPNNASMVYIRASDKDDPTDLGGKIFFEGMVSLGEAFMIDAANAGEDDLKSETHVHIYDANPASGGQVLQSIEFHTSCSQELRLGDQYGAIGLIGFLDKNGQGGENPTCVDPCLVDQAPPSIQFTAVNDGGGIFIDVLVTDDTALDEVTYLIGGDPGSLSFVDREDVSPQEVRLRFSIDDVTLNGELFIDATDQCDKVACLDDAAPTVTATVDPELLRDGDGNLVEDPNLPGFAWELAGRGVASDDQGVQTLQFFLMNNTRILLLDESGFEPTIELQLEPPPVGVVGQSFLGGTDVPFGFQAVERPGTFRFGALAADQCNAFILDPGAQSGGAQTLAKSGSGQGWFMGEALTLDLNRPERFELETNFPNPFRGLTTIRFALPEATKVRLAVYDMLGREVAVLADGQRQAGRHQVVFDGRRLATGVYMYRLVTPEQTAVGKMMLVR